MSPQKDGRLQDAYAVFGRDHQSLRQEMLARVREQGATIKLGLSIAGAGFPLRRWLLAAAVGFAATIIVSAGASLLLQPSDPTGNVSLLSSKIRIVKSVCVPGWYDSSLNRDLD